MTITDIDGRRAYRTALMNWIFDQAAGSQQVRVDPKKFPDRGNDHDLGVAIDYLEGEGLLKVSRTFGGYAGVQMTHAGIREIEQARSRPERPTEHFAPMVNITNVQGSIIGSQIQQGSPGATQSGTNTVDQAAAFREFIAAVRQAAEGSELDEADRQRINSDADFMEGELARPEPRWERLRAIGLGVQSVIMSGLGGALGSAIYETPWHQVVSSPPWS